MTVFSIILVTFQYNLICVVCSRYYYSNQLYSIALKQLFIDLYILKLCCVDLFLLNRDSNNIFFCIDQTVIIIIILICTAIFQFFLRQDLRLLLSQKSFASAQQDYRGAKNLLDKSDRSKSIADNFALYQNSIFLCRVSTIWISRNNLKVAERKLRSFRQFRTTIALSIENAKIDFKSQITVSDNLSVSEEL